jgi:hypothetical protein
MTRRPLVAIALAAPLLLLAPRPLAANATKPTGDPKPIDPTHTLKPKGTTGGDGYFDDVFGMDNAGKALAVIRTDGASFAKLEIYDVAAG